jgi:hypothetical protein
MNKAIVAFWSCGDFYNKTIEVGGLLMDGASLNKLKEELIEEEGLIESLVCVVSINVIYG